MREAVIVEAVRTPIARGKPGVGDLSDFHATKLLPCRCRKSSIVPAWNMPTWTTLAGCVTQAGEQAGNITRNAWLTLGKDYTAGGTTLDNQCGSAQTANHMISSMVSSGSVNIGIACGVEAMSRVGLAPTSTTGPAILFPLTGHGIPVTTNLPAHNVLPTTAALRVKWLIN